MTERELLADLAATFPGLNPRPLSTFKAQRFDVPGAWFRDCPDMPDSMPIYALPWEVGNCDPEGYSCMVHDAFLMWLENRGWHLETYDYGTYVIVPLALVCGDPAEVLS